MTNERVPYREAGHLTAEDNRLLDLLQNDFSLAPEPFEVLASKIGKSSADVIEHIRSLKEQGVIRHIRGTFDSRQLGYQSTLVAMSVESAKLDSVADHISQHTGVSHNYARDHNYNLWFTLTLSSDKSIAETVESFARASGVKKVITLPALRVFKIDVRFDMGRAPVKPQQSRKEVGTIPVQHGPLSGLEIAAVRQLQRDISLVVRPFDFMAESLDVGIDRFLEIAQTFLQRGVMRRYGGVVNHRRIGYMENAMGCWIVPSSMIEGVGGIMASFAAVTHCYERPTFPDWPYNVFTMIHGHTREECQEVAGRIAREVEVENYLLLYSTKEFKKESINYFV